MDRSNTNRLSLFKKSNTQELGAVYDKITSSMSIGIKSKETGEKS